MASTVSADFDVIPAAYEQAAKSTALAYRFMVRRSLAQFRGGLAADAAVDVGETQPARVLVRTLKAPPAQV